MQGADNIILGPVVAHYVQLWLETQMYWARSPVGWDDRHRDCAHEMPQTVQRPGLCSALCGTVY